MREGEGGGGEGEEGVREGLREGVNEGRRGREKEIHSNL